jgi:hypothetical protein
MPTKSDNWIKREVSIAGKPYTLNIGPSGMQLVPRPQGGRGVAEDSRVECFLIGYDQDEAKLSS